MSEFFVGYLPQSPPGIRRRVRILVGAIFVLSVAGAIFFATSQKHFTNSKFEFGQVNEFAGTIVSGPFPILVGPDTPDTHGSSAPHLMCAPGKHGADALMQPYAGKIIKLRGSLIERQEGKMIEIVPGSITELGPSKAKNSQEKDLGERELRGEIIDTKCFLGVMNPGEGKVHRDCAALCLHGGIPPALYTKDFDGTLKILLLTDSTGTTLAQSAFLRLVGQPVRIRGHVFESNGLLYLRTSPSEIAVLP